MLNDGGAALVVVVVVVVVVVAGSVVVVAAALLENRAIRPRRITTCTGRESIVPKTVLGREWRA
jgi:hypothetical protein